MRACLSGLSGCVVVLAIMLVVWGKAGWQTSTLMGTVLVLLLPTTGAAVCVLLALRRRAVVRRLVREGVLVRAEVLDYREIAQLPGHLMVKYRLGDRELRKDISVKRREGRRLAAAGEVYLLVSSVDPNVYALAMPD